MGSQKNDLVACLHCGAQIPRKAKACPECGSDEHTGWSSEGYLDGVDLGSDEFDDNDYQEAAQREFGTGPSTPPAHRSGLWVKIVAAVLLALAALVFLSRLGC